MARSERIVRAIQRKREESERVAVRRWQHLDLLVLRGIGMYLGAVLASLQISLMPDSWLPARWYFLCLCVSVAVYPLLLLYVTKYLPPSRVTIDSGSDKLEFRFVEKMRVEFLKNDMHVFHDLASVELDPTERSITLEEDPGQDRKAEPLTVCIEGERWPAAELGHVLAMMRTVSDREWASCMQDFQVMTTKVINQVLTWTIRDYLANSSFHTWQENFGNDLLLALCLWLIFWVLTLCSKLFRLPPYTSFHNPPFFEAEADCKSGFSRICQGYFQVIMGSLPLSVGFCFNQVLTYLHNEALNDIQHTDASRSDYKGSIFLFSYAVYFLIVAILCVCLKVYSKNIFVWIFQHHLLKTVVHAIDTKCCCSHFKLDAEAQAEVEEEKEAKEKDGMEGQSQLKHNAHDHTQQPRPSSPDDTPEVSAMAEEVAWLRMQVHHLAKAVGVLGSVPRTIDNELHNLPNSRHWKIATINATDEASIKTLQFLFAWAALYLLQHIYYTWLMECNRKSSDPWSVDCTYHQSFALSLILAGFAFVYLYLIGGIGQQSGLQAAWFDLQMQAIPLIVGWTWKGFADDILVKLKEEWGSQSMTVVYIVLFVTLYVFAMVGFHTYSVVSRDYRMKYSALALA